MQKINNTVNKNEVLKRTYALLVMTLVFSSLTASANTFSHYKFSGYFNYVWVYIV